MLRESLDSAVRTTIDSLQDEFLLTLEEDGTNALATFIDSWTLFHETIQPDTLQPDTLALVHAFSSTVWTVFSYLDKQLSTSDNICEQLTSDLTTILEDGMRRLNIDESSHIDRNASSYPRYIQPSYTWLLDNIHNPYPSKEVKMKISIETGCSYKDIDNWFIDTRKRIRWNHLCKSRFSNKRADLVKAATDFFVDKKSISPTIELKLMGILDDAKSLYTEKFVESTLATTLDVAVKDMTPELKAKAKAEEKKRRASQKKCRRKQPNPAPYPSPEPSPDRSPEPSSPQMESSETSIQETVESPSRKRARSSSPYPSDGEVPRPTLSNKRTRLDTPSSPEETSLCQLPSPAASVHEIDQPLQLPTYTAVTSPLPPSNTKKRRLSVSHSEPPSKRLRSVPFEPPTHDVSDSLPNEELGRKLFGDLFTPWQTPDVVEELDSLANLDITFGLLGYPDCSSSLSSDDAHAITPSQDAELPLVSKGPDTFDFSQCPQLSGHDLWLDSHHNYMVSNTTLIPEERQHSSIFDVDSGSETIRTTIDIESITGSLDTAANNLPYHSSDDDLFAHFCLQMNDSASSYFNTTWNAEQDPAGIAQPNSGFGSLSTADYTYPVISSETTIDPRVVLEERERELQEQLEQTRRAKEALIATSAVSA